MDDKRPDRSSEPDRSPPLATAGSDCCVPTTGGNGNEPKAMAYLSSESWTVGSISTPAGDISQVATRLTAGDRRGHWRVRWSIGRMTFAIRPGLYAVGQPNRKSPVFVTANYKMSFDRLREQLDGRDGWIMVLDTRGINVWCAAGKGTFGTEEIINRIRSTRLSEIVSQRRLIVPQLGAPGIQAHVVQQQTGFVVRYGPIRAADLPTYLDNGRKATPEMRMVRFDIGDRLVLAPMELIGYGGFALLAVIVLALLSGFGAGVYSLERVLTHGLRAAVPILGGTLAGSILVPLLLPWLPGRSFSAKGVWAGLAALLFLASMYFLQPLTTPHWASLVAGSLMILSIASFIGMNFTGSSTYTSLSGVRREMKRWVPVQAVSGVVGLGFWVAVRFV